MSDESKKAIDTAKKLVLQHLECYSAFSGSDIPADGLLALIKSNITALFDNVITKEIEKEKDQE